MPDVPRNIRPGRREPNPWRFLLPGFICLLALGAASCRNGGGDQDPEANFEYFWRSFDRTYGQFPNKQVDWAALYREYRPRVTPATSPDELFDVIAAVMSHLDDGHVWLISKKRQFCASKRWGRPEEKDFSLPLVRDHYLRPGARTVLDGAVVYGWLADGVGYIYIRDFMFDEPAVDSVMAGVFDAIGSASAIVADVRDNSGGTGHVANRVADHFADRKRHFMSSKMRYGPEPDDTLPMHFHVRPRGAAPFRKPIVLLTNRGTASAAERFTLAMRVLPHATIVGDTTAGLFSVKYRIMMPNKWLLDISYKMSTDHLGTCWDGIGFPPDILHEAREAEIARGKDGALERALSLLQEGPPAVQDESASLVHVRTSLVDTYFDALAAGGVDAASAALQRVLADDPDTRFLDMKHCLRVADPYVFDGRAAQVIPILELAMATYPRVAMTYDLLSAAYVNSGDEARARDIVERGADVPRMYPWEGKLFDDVKAALDAEP